MSTNKEMNKRNGNVMYDRTSLHQKTSAHEWRRVRAGPAVGEEGPSQSRQTKGRGTNISQRQRVKLIVRSVRMYEVPPNANCADEQTGEAKVVTTRVVGNLSSTRLKNRNGQVRCIFTPRRPDAVRRQTPEKTFEEF